MQYYLGFHINNLHYLKLLFFVTIYLSNRPNFKIKKCIEIYSLYHQQSLVIDLYIFTFSFFSWGIQLKFANLYKKYLPVVPSGCHGDSVESTLSYNSLSVPVNRCISAYLYISFVNTTQKISNCCQILVTIIFLTFDFLLLCPFVLVISNGSISSIFLLCYFKKIFSY